MGPAVLQWVITLYSEVFSVFIKVSVSLLLGIGLCVVSVLVKL